MHVPKSPAHLRTLTGIHSPTRCTVHPYFGKGLSEIRKCPGPGPSSLFTNHSWQVSSQQQPSSRDLLSLGLGVPTVTVSALAGQLSQEGAKFTSEEARGFRGLGEHLPHLSPLPNSFHKPAPSKLPAVHPSLALPRTQRGSGWSCAKEKPSALAH